MSRVTQWLLAKPGRQVTPAVPGASGHWRDRLLQGLVSSRKSHLSSTLNVALEGTGARGNEEGVGEEVRSEPFMATNCEQGWTCSEAE